MINTMICDNAARRDKVLKHPQLNGIDYVEVPKGDQQNIRVYFIKPKPPGLTSNEIRVEGGARIRNIRVEGVDPTKFDENKHPYLEVRVNQTGDFSTYTLVIENDLVDVGFASCPFSFKVGCPSDFDCSRKVAPSTIPQDTPVIDYLAKDYASFRQALLDRIPLLVPGWQERHEADLGITLVELLAYVGDQLSYYQDAIANEAYLETARQRESVRRHARLIDYPMHDGANARTFMHFTIKESESVTIPKCTRLALLSRIDVPIGASMPPHGTIISDTVRQQALAAADIVFEYATGKEEEITFHASLNEIPIHTWGNRLCCLPKGSTSLDLVGDFAFDLHDLTRQEGWRLKKGDFILLEEIIAPETGEKADADLHHRQVVRLTNVELIKDGLFNYKGELWKSGDVNLSITRIFWHRADALTFPLWISSQCEDGTLIENVSVARGNLILADHGQTIDEEWHPANPKAEPEAPGIAKKNIAYRFELKNGPITFHTPQPKDEEERSSVQEMLEVEPRKTTAHASLELHEEGPNPPHWEVVPHLFDSKPFDRHFTVETRNNGRSSIRFGDGTYGMEPPQGAHIHVTYRIGNGAAGNVGSETLVHVLPPPNSGPISWPAIEAVCNPLPAWGGTEPETIDQVKLLAPKAFHVQQFRAVTEDDYAKAAEQHPAVDRAIATFRWTGSWHTVCVTIDPVGRTDLPSDLETHVRKHIARYKLAGYDIEIDLPLYVYLAIEIDVCVTRDHFRAHVKEALMEALSNRMLPDGRRGFFHPDNFTFAQAVYLSRLYAAIEAVEGVDSAVGRRFMRLHESDPDDPQRPTTTHNMGQGYIAMGRLEIAGLDNDPNFPENGVLRLNMMGGK